MEIASRVKTSFEACRRSGRLGDAFARWRDRHPALGDLQSIDDLVQLCRDAPSELYPAKNDALRAVCLEAANGDESASLFLLWIMIPALLAEWKSISRQQVLAPDDVEAELLAGFWEALKWVGPESRKVALRLVHGARRRALAALKREAAWKSVAEPIPEEEPLDSSAWTPDPEDFLADAEREGIVSALDVELLLAPPDGFRRIASREGLTLNAAQIRARKARDRIAAYLDGDDPSSRRLPPEGITKFPQIPTDADREPIDAVPVNPTERRHVG